jgi:hypothetical protein
MIDESLDSLATRVAGHPELLRNARRHALRARFVGEVDVTDTVRESETDSGGHGQCDPALTDATFPGQRDQPCSFFDESND